MTYYVDVPNALSKNLHGDSLLCSKNRTQREMTDAERVVWGWIKWEKDGIIRGKIHTYVFMCHKISQNSGFQKYGFANAHSVANLL